MGSKSTFLRVNRLKIIGAFTKAVMESGTVLSLSNPMPNCASPRAPNVLIYPSFIYEYSIRIDSYNFSHIEIQTKSINFNVFINIIL